MSLLVTGLVWKHADVGDAALLVLLAMADIADDRGEQIWPSMETLAAKARCDVRTVRRSMRMMESIGLISQLERARGTPGQFNAWRINLETVILSCPDGKYGPRPDRKGNKEGGQIVPPGLSTGHGVRGGGALSPGREDISSRHIDNNPLTVLEQSFPRDDGAAESAAAARSKWEEVCRRLSPTKFLNRFAAAGAWRAAQPVCLDGGTLVVEIDSVHRLSQVWDVQAAVEAIVGMPVCFRLTAEAEARMPRRA